MDTAAPGLKWRKRADGRRAPYWIARQELVRAGYTPKTVPLFYDETDPAYMQLIAARCRVLQAEMLQWGGENQAVMFGGTLRDLIRIYQTEEMSPFHKKRPHTKRTYFHDMKVLELAHGDSYLERIGGRDLLRWYEDHRRPKIDGGPERIRLAHGLMTMLRIIVGFGVVMEIPHCVRLRTILSEIEFSSPAPRKERLSSDHADAIRSKANELGLPSVALAQALQFELTLRQKDVIGEWVALDEPGLSGVVWNRQKWLSGIRWEEITDDLLLTHTSSKTAVETVFDLKSSPMVADELTRVPPEARNGPVIVSEATGMPYRARHFAAVWRRVADAAGVPKAVWNMDSRAGGVTEATDADPSREALEAVRHMAGHRNISTTQRYSRPSIAKSNKVAQLRVAHRNRAGWATTRPPATSAISGAETAHSR